MKRLVTMMALWLTVWTAHGQIGEGELLYQIPPRPDGHVLDAAKWLPEGERLALEKRLTVIRERDRVDLVVAIFSREPVLDPPVFTQRLAEEWGKGASHAAVVHFIGDPESPYFAYGGVIAKVVSQKFLAKHLNDVTKAAARQPSESERVEAAIAEAANRMVFVTRRVQTAAEQFTTAYTRNYQEKRLQEMKRKILLTVGITTSVVLGLGLLVITILLRRRMRPLFFPETSWRSRLGAPYGGGNDAGLTWGAGRAHHD